jgi:integrase
VRQIDASSPVAGSTPVSQSVSAVEKSCSRSGPRDEQVLHALAQACADFAAALNAIAGAARGCDSSSVTLPGVIDQVPLTRAPASALTFTAAEVTVIEAVKEFLHCKARAGRSDRYLQALRNSLKKFAYGRAHTPLWAVTVQDVDKWLEKSHWSPRTQKGYLSDVCVLYNFCIRRGLCRSNPAAAVELPVYDTGKVEIHTPQQVAQVLEFARTHDLNLCRCLAVRYFGGLRSSEATRLEEKEIKETFVEVTASKSKTRRRRLVTIQPNLASWLKLGGELPLRDFNNRYRWFTAALKAEKQIEWPHNVTRHSFVSYHLAQFQSAGKTALEAGHTEQMIFAHYREVVTAQSAAEYWQIFPQPS